MIYYLAELADRFHTSVFILDIVYFVGLFFAACLYHSGDGEPESRKVLPLGLKCAKYFIGISLLAFLVPSGQTILQAA